MVLTLLLAGSAAAEGEPRPGDVRYTVVAGDTCMKIVRRAYGDVRYLDFFHSANPGMGPPPHSLVAGTVLIIPAKPPVPPHPPDARLTWLRNRVEAFTPERHPGQRNEALMRGHRVSTLEESSAEVTFFDESRMQLGEDTLVVILGDNAGAARRGVADTTLLSGALRAHLGELAGTTARAVPVATPAGRAVLDPGEAQISVDKERSTRLAVYRGKGRLQAKGREVTVKQDFGSRADLGRPPTPPRPLPTAPAWIVRPPKLVLVVGAPAVVRGEFGPGPTPPRLSSRLAPGQVVPPPARWHVQVARDSRFNDLILDGRLPAETHALEVRNVGAGVYFARVSAIDADQFEGRFGEVAIVRAVAGTLVPPAPPTQGRLDVPDGLFCGVDGGPLAETGGGVPLPDGPRHTVRCAVDARGTGLTELVVETPAPPAPAAPQLPLAPPVLIPAAPESAPEPPPGVVSVEGALLPMLRIGDDYRRGSLGLGVAGQLGLAFRIGRESLAVAVRGGYDHYDDTPGHHVLSLALPLAWRFANPEAVWVPYLGAVPQLTWEHTLARGDQRARTFAIGGLLGLAWNRGPHALFLEAGYERRFDQEPARGDLPDGSFTFGLGYRFRLWW